MRRGWGGGGRKLGGGREVGKTFSGGSGGPQRSGNQPSLICFIISCVFAVLEVMSLIKSLLPYWSQS